MAIIWKSIEIFWNQPNKPWFKIGKLLLTIIRCILFMIFIILLMFSRALSSKNVPTLCLYLILIYNWRFLFALLILFTIIILKVFKCCCCLGDAFYLSAKKKLHKLILDLFWKRMDWPCFLRLKYYFYIFDIVHYFAYLVSCIVVGTIQILNPNIYIDPIVVFFINIPLFLIHIFIEIYRVVQAQRVQSCIRDIFGSDVKFSSKALLMISEDQLGSMSCPNIFGNNETCQIANAEHRAFSHPKDIFNANFVNCNYKQMGVNICIGFHQTTIAAAKSILTTTFRPSETGMIGPGIYFANNYDITEHKRNQSTEGGAIFCARIDMGKVYEIVSKDDQRDLSKFYNTKYLHHMGGEKFDEFVVYSHEQILDYVIIVENKAIENYRKTVQKPYCNCINFI